LNEVDVNSATAAMLKLSELGLWIDDTPRISPMTLRMRMRRAQARHPFACMYVDYLQLLDGSAGAGRRGDRVAEVGYIATELKQTARELGIPLIVAAQLSRTLENRADKRPMLADLRESGSIEQEADQVAFLYRQDVYYGPNDPQYDLSMKDVSEVLVRKNRNGDLGEFHLKWDGAARRLVEPQMKKI
ncbi:MAG: DnaB-like helicase C-terminal domain-containing protein, partial [Candidatus Methylumidiphilus sp.]